MNKNQTRQSAPLNGALLLRITLKPILWSLSLLFFLPFFASAATLHKPPNNLGLVGYWNFNEGTSTQAGDASGNGNTGTLTNMANPPTSTSGWGTGKRGSGLNFDGVDDNVDFGTNSSLDISGAGAMSVWFKQNGNAGGAYHALVNRFAGGGYQMGILNNGKFFFWNGGATVDSTYTLSSSDKNWHHYVATSDGATVSFYVDGVAYGTGAKAFSLSTPTTHNLGQFTINGISNGLMDEVRIYNRALAASEVASLYGTGAAKVNHSQNSRITNGLIGMWSFNGDDMNWGSRLAFDRSPNGYNGNLTGFSLSTSPVVGVIGQALYLNGVNNEMTIAPGALLGATSVSVSAWVKVQSFSESTFSGTPATTLGAVIFNTRNTNTDVSPTLVISPSSGGAGTQNAITFACDSSGLGVGAKGATGISLNTWVHVVGTFAYTGTGVYGGNWNVYLNGVKDNSAVNNFTLAGTCTGSFTGTTWRIGNASQWPSPDNEFTNATFDEVRVYNRELSAAEAKQLYLMGAAKVNHSQNSRITNGLVGLWSFNGPDLNWNTNVAIDGSGNGNNGSLLAMPTTTAPVMGKVGQALNFDGTASVRVSPDTKINDLTTMTVSAWFNQANCNSGYCAIVGKGFGITPTVDGWKLTSDIRGFGVKTIGFTADFTGTNLLVESADTFSESAWNHVVVTWDGSTSASNVHIYLNGIEVSYGTQTSGVGTYNSDALRFLGIGNVQGVNLFTGKIDEVRVYNRVLALSEIKQLYLMGK